MPRRSPAGTVITNRSNSVIRDVRALLRAPSRRAVRLAVEGWRLLEAAVDAAIPIEVVLYTPEAAETARWAHVRGRLRSSGAREALVSPPVFAALAQVETPQGVLGVVRRPEPGSPALLKDRHALLVVLDGVQDPGNVGAILRTAAAAGATAGATVGSAADPFSPKALRASAGAVFRLPLFHFAAAPEASAELTQAGLRLLLADPRGRTLDADASFARPVALIFGSEGAGADPAWRKAGAESVRIPLRGAVESLNVAAAAAVLLYRAADVTAPAS